MRFVANGPDIPGELLEARDAGRVIFFCGSGVSRHRAHGPDFAELARRVADGLGSLPDSPARRLLAMAANIAPMPGVGGIVAADRVFALLEQEFAAIDVRAAVARAVEPPPGASADAHRTMIDLSTGPDGVVRLVTTNFDLLFEAASPGIRSWTPPMLPDPERTGLFSGAVYLHGKVTPGYDAIESEEFVVSSADFGRAYLAEGWATRFMQSLIERFKVVFLGYSADDPPMQYLLEALRSRLPSNSLYAFQSGEAAAATGLWRHKGVRAIPFAGFVELWATLELWARRARDPAAWRGSIINLARRGPRGLAPHERGQVAHLVSSRAGTAAFAAAEPPPPAEWLCTFDPGVRFATPQTSWSDPDGPVFDNLARYGVDGDPPSTSERPDDPKSRRVLPPGAWSAVDRLPDDADPDPAASASPMRGQGTGSPRGLSPRLSFLAGWLARVAEQPMAMWWASAQHGLHPELLNAIERSIVADAFDASARSAWRMLIDARRERTGHQDFDLAPYAAAERIQKDGWSAAALRVLDAATRPRLLAERSYSGPPLDSNATVTQQVRFEVSFPSPPDGIEVPEAWLARYLRILRAHVDLAVELETETSPIPFYDLRPLHSFPLAPNEDAHEIWGLSSIVRRLADHVERLAAVEPSEARREVDAWGVPDDPVRAQLAIWAAARPTLRSSAEAAAVLVELPTAIFWSSELERDLLHALGQRWGGFTTEERAAIEARLLAGEDDWEDVDADQMSKRRAWSVLTRLFWLRRAGLATGFDLDAEIAARHAIVPEWTDEDASDRLDRSSSRGGWVRTDTEHGSLIDVAPRELLARVRELSGRSRDFLVETRPFKGLVETRPVLSLSAIRLASASGQDVGWAWSDFLWSEARAKDPIRLRVLVAERVARLSDGELMPSLQSACFWLRQRGAPLWKGAQESYLRLWNRLGGLVEAIPAGAGSALIRQGEPDWVTAAVNSPAGRLAELLFDELTWSGEERTTPDADWLSRAARLLSIDGEPKAHAAAMFGMRLAWLFDADRTWTERFLLPILEGNRDEDATRAALAGFLRNGRLSTDLFLRVREVLVRALTETHRLGTRHGQVAGMLLAGWASRDANGERLIASAMMRHALVAASEADRLAAIRQVARWAQAKDGAWATERLTFLREVWPKQLAAKSPQASSALADMALEAGDDTAAMTAAVLPLLTPIGGAGPTNLRWLSRRDGSVEAHPEEHLAILFAILPDRAAEWPYGMTSLVERLDGIPALTGDPRLAELRRRGVAR